MELYSAGAIEQVCDESVLRLDGGGLPVLAERRLAALFGSPAGLFSSHLSVSEFALMRSVSLRPVSQVMGSCVYHARLALDRSAPVHTAERGKAYAMTGVAEPWNAARERALARMAAEARSCRADAVVGVGIRQTQEHLAGRYDASVECVATGTAVVHVVPQAGPSGPVLTNLSAQDYLKLRQQGYAAVGIVACTTVYGCVPSVELHQAEVSRTRPVARYANWEIPEFSDGLRLAHRAAMTNMRAQAERLGAEGIVGVTIERDQHTAVARHDSYQDLILAVHVTGTAIARQASPPHGNPLAVNPVRHLDKKGGG